MLRATYPNLRGERTRTMTTLSLDIDGEVVDFAPEGVVILGRDDSADFRVPNVLVSRRHLELRPGAANWLARDLHTMNGTFVSGARIPAERGLPIEAGMVLMLGDPLTGSRVQVLGRRGASPVDDTVGRTSCRDAVRLGRSPGNDVVIPDPMVSAHHARLTRLGGARYLLDDLGSTNGTFVDGVRIERREVVPGQVVSLGGAFFQVTADGLVRIAVEGAPAGPGRGEPEVALRVSDLTFTVPVDASARAQGAPDRKALLDRVTFTVPHRSLLAVIGPSGAGKSTLLKAMTGALQPDAGQVLFNGLDLANFAKSLADRIGIVPQDDLVHPELTARQALDYAARLRFPDDATPAERADAVGWALTELGLTSQAELRIRQLSGGQRKRVSTAMELLTKPDLLFLDEPTSGLDPNLDREVMQLLGTLAHGTAQNPSGRTVVVVTHSTQNLDKADLVLLLAPGGKVAYFGPPGQLPDFFAPRLGADTSYPGIYALIAGAPDAAQAAFAASRLAPRSSVPAHVAAPSPPTRSRPRRLLPQALTLLSRQTRLMAADRSLLLFTLALPVVVGLLTTAVRATDGFNAARTTDAVTDPRILLVVLVFGAVLMGIVPSVRQLVGERAIFLREAGVGVRPSAYLASKALLLGVVCAIQSALMVTVALLVNVHPATGVAWPLWVELWVVAFAIAWASSGLGLLLSSRVSTSEQVMPLMVLVLMFQLVMSGGVLDVTGPGVNQVSLTALSRWGFAAGAASLDFNRSITCNAEILITAKEDEEVNKKTKEVTDEQNQKAADNATKNGLPIPTPKAPKVQHRQVDCATVADQDPLWEATGLRWLGNLLALGFWTTAYLVGTYFSLRRTARR